jgi:hypothetical protein
MRVFVSLFYCFIFFGQTPLFSAHLGDCSRLIAGLGQNSAPCPEAEAILVWLRAQIESPPREIVLGSRNQPKDGREFAFPEFQRTEFLRVIDSSAAGKIVGRIPGTSREKRAFLFQLAWPEESVTSGGSTVAVETEARSPEMTMPREISRAQKDSPRSPIATILSTPFAMIANLVRNRVGDQPDTAAPQEGARTEEQDLARALNSEFNGNPPIVPQIWSFSASAQRKQDHPWPNEWKNFRFVEFSAVILIGGSLSEHTPVKLGFVIVPTTTK